MTADVIVCTTPTVATRRHISACPGRCGGQRRRVVSAWPASPYYGPVFTCCACGDQWSDGELLARPFAPGWRDRNTTKALAVWVASQAGPILRDNDGYIVVSDTERTTDGHGPA